ncbi:hypothetical protein H0E87_031428, partial [Populus deltoides]
PFLAHAYDFFRPVGSMVSWNPVVWEQWSLPKHNFILWLAVLGRLRTRDRLQFLPIDPTCAFCRCEEETHAHLFFSCNWTGCLWAKIKSWLRIGRRMLSLNSALRGLNSKRSNVEFRMRRVSLAITVYLIWEERNKRVFDATSRGVDIMVGCSPWLTGDCILLLSLAIGCPVSLPSPRPVIHGQSLHTMAWLCMVQLYSSWLLLGLSSSRHGGSQASLFDRLMLSLHGCAVSAWLLGFVQISC